MQVVCNFVVVILGHARKKHVDVFDPLRMFCHGKMSWCVLHGKKLKAVYSEGVRNEVRGDSRGLRLFSQRPQRLFETLGRCTEDRDRAFC